MIVLSFCPLLYMLTSSSLYEKKFEVLIYRRYKDFFEYALALYLGVGI